jgi:hypothetical protein
LQAYRNWCAISKNHKNKIQNTKQNTKYKIQNTKYKIQNTKYKIQNTKYKIQKNKKTKNKKQKTKNKKQKNKKQKTKDIDVWHSIPTGVYCAHYRLCTIHVANYILQNKNNLLINETKDKIQVAFARGLTSMKTQPELRGGIVIEKGVENTPSIIR